MESTIFLPDCPPFDGLRSALSVAEVTAPVIPYRSDGAFLKPFPASFQSADMAPLHFWSGACAQVNINSRFTPLEGTFWPFCAPFEAESPGRCKAISGHFQAR